MTGTSHVFLAKLALPAHFPHEKAGSSLDVTERYLPVAVGVNVVSERIGVVGAVEPKPPEGRFDRLLLRDRRGARHRLERDPIEGKEAFDDDEWIEDVR